MPGLGWSFAVTKDRVSPLDSCLRRNDGGTASRPKKSKPEALPTSHVVMGLIEVLALWLTVRSHVSLRAERPGLIAYRLKEGNYPRDDPAPGSSLFGPSIFRSFDTLRTPQVQRPRGGGRDGNPRYPPYQGGQPQDP